MFSLANHSSLMHNFVDSFFESKKLAVKARLRDTMEAIVDDLFVEMVVQVKEMLLPPKETKMPLKPEAQNFPQFTSRAFTQNPIFSSFASKPNFQNNFNEVKPSVSGQKRAFPENEDTEMNMSSAKKVKKKNFVDELPKVEEFGDDDNFAFYNLDEEALHITDKTPLFESYGNAQAEFDYGTSFFAGKTNKSQKTSSKPATKSNTEKKFKCTEEGCDKSFAKSDHLKVHNRTVHAKVKPYVCNFDPENCSFASGDRSHTVRHIRNVHLKKAETSTEEGESSKPPDQDPAKYLTVKKELL